MTNYATEEEQPAVGAVTVVYLGPIAPHWEVRASYGDRDFIDEFRGRTHARLLLLPPHDPQFRRNRERVNRDAAASNLTIEWDLGYDEEEYAAERAAAAEAYAAAKAASAAAAAATASEQE